MRRRLVSSTGSVIGLDLSLRAAAACALPIKWDHNLNRVRTTIAGRDLPKDADSHDQILRLHDIAGDIVAFCKQFNAKQIYVEEYAFSQGLSRAHALGELGGVVKYELWRRLKIAPIPVTASRARKTLLQKVPRSKSKPFVIKNVKRLGGQTQFWTDDEVDAFVVANYGLMVEGSVAMSFEGE